MSLVVNRGKSAPGCALLFDGEEDTPLPKASSATPKNLEVSTRRWFEGCAPKNCTRSPDTPYSHVGMTTALSRAAFKEPKVRYPTRQCSITLPLCSLHCPSSANCCTPFCATPVEEKKDSRTAATRLILQIFCVITTFYSIASARRRGETNSRSL